MEKQTTKSIITKLLSALGISFILTVIASALQPQELLAELLKIDRSLFITILSYFIGVIALGLIAAIIVAIAQAVRKQPCRDSAIYSFQFTSILLAILMLGLCGYSRWKFDPRKRELIVQEYNEQLNKATNEIDEHSRATEMSKLNAQVLDAFRATEKVDSSKKTTKSLNQKNIGAGISIDLPSSWSADSKELMEKKLQLMKELGKVENDKVRLFSASPTNATSKAHGLIRIGIMNKPSLSQMKLNRISQKTLVAYLRNENSALIANTSLGIDKGSISIKKIVLSGFSATRFSYQRKEIMGSGLRNVSLYEIPFKTKRIYVTTSYPIKRKDDIGKMINDMLASISLDESYEQMKAVSIKDTIPEQEHRVKQTDAPKSKTVNSKSDKRLTDLERKMSLLISENEDLKTKVLKLEKKAKPTSIQKMRDSEQWKIIANWRKLKKGMSKETVLSILGQPRKAGGDYWYYGKGSEEGNVHFFIGNKLHNWDEPEAK